MCWTAKKIAISLKMWDRKICIEWWWWVLYSDLTHKKSILEAPFCIKIYFDGEHSLCFKILCSRSISIQIMRWYCSLKVTAGSHMRCFFFSAEIFFRELFFLKSNKSKRPATKYFNFSFFVLALLFICFGWKFLSVEGEVLRPTDCLMYDRIWIFYDEIMWSRNYWFFKILFKSAVDYVKIIKTFGFILS